ncbi:MAG: S46 family peptidase [Planctomycetota bacterium]
MKRISWLLLAPLAFAACAQFRHSSSAPRPLVGTPDELIAFAKNPYAVGGGMWTYHNPPIEMLEKLHQFTPSKDWLDSVRQASVRFPQGSASFVSPEGLVLTNHHVGRDAIQQLSSKENDYIKNGFAAANREGELKCSGLVLHVLVSTEDVTHRVKGAKKPGMTAQDANKAVDDEIKKIVEESNKSTKLHTEMSNLYQGGEYWIYRFKAYSDVRLVFAPEDLIAFYGGDPDNFTYPRYCLDFALFRVYEEGKPAATPHYFKFNTNGAADGELVFVSGNPGSTARLQTIAQMEYSRDHGYPRQLELLKRQRDALVEYSKRSAEHERKAKTEIFSVENSIKAISGYYGGLLDPKLMSRKLAEEAYLKSAVYGSARLQDVTIQARTPRPELAIEVGDAWGEIEKTRAKFATRLPQLIYTNIPGGLAGIAMRFARFANDPGKDEAEITKNSESLKKAMSADTPINAEMDEALMVAMFKLASEKLPKNDPFIAAAIGNQSPEQAAQNAIRNTKLTDMEFRKKLAEGGKAAIDASNDSMIKLARSVAPILQELQKWRENEITANELSPLDRIAKARFAVYGRSLPPDANFKLRLSPGVVKGYEEDTTLVPYKTTLYGLFERSTSFDQREPFTMPKRWADAEKKLDLKTPFNFVNTCDIIGGNSGSPVINKKKELVGLIFDGNIQSLPNRFLYDDVDQRAVAVHSAAIVASLRDVYDGGWIADEIAGK